MFSLRMVSAGAQVHAASSRVTAAPTKFRDVLLLTPQVYSDDRGFFLESYNEQEFAALGIHAHFVQDNHSYSRQNTLRGLHYQVKHEQGKLVRVISGSILDVTVDLRKSSPTFAQWQSIELSGQNRGMLWIPSGFAHGFRVLSEDAHVVYKTTDFYSPTHERTLAWDDAEIAIDWQLSGAPTLSAKDSAGTPLHKAELFK